jgi:tRNA (mo5U34)-methyltransferase
MGIAKMSYTKEEIERMIKEIPVWWHTIDLGNGIKTPGRTPPHYHKAIIDFLPQDFTGKSVLDIGAWDGYYSFYAEQRGAKRVLAIDNLQHDIKCSFRQESVGTNGFELVKKILNSKVEYKVMDGVDIDKLDENFDIIFCFGVYYHCENPFLLFRKIYDKLDETLFVEGYIRPGPDYSVHLFYPGELDNDPTNVWGFTSKALIRLLEIVGFKIQEVRENYIPTRILIRCSK